MPRPYVITISGSDASGGAGLQADNRAILSTGAFPLNVITALSLQTDRGVESLDLISVDLVRMHLLGLLKAYPVSVLKVGMLGNAEIVQVLVDVLEQYRDLKVVLDPVLRATSGRPLLDQEGFSLLKDRLLPRIFLLAPNLPELVAFSDSSELGTEETEAGAVAALLETGCHAVLVKGGHGLGNDCVDRLFWANESQDFTSPKVDTQNARGTGCALASLIAGGLANGLELQPAIHKAKLRLHQSLIDRSDEDWKGHGPGFL
ncbi:hydroxymethylpyrimidine/phosphomethylpyrimidine kinase [Opitutia bacterium ISCC 51]|nr:hydroxymethylpyrimidine/phosphomethylpyrimidine kinase [Opitutae bacterium ISCC 51]QXD29484.1 hydroxymethylpyrimidine/phosphomethylpyrimidine kinase [Opitutae bacterium ISCC 52]